MRSNRYRHHDENNVQMLDANNFFGISVFHKILSVPYYVANLQATVRLEDPVYFNRDAWISLLKQTSTYFVATPKKRASSVLESLSMILFAAGTTLHVALAAVSDRTASASASTLDVYVANQSVCACCATFEKLYSDTRQPMPSITVEMLAVNPNEAQQPRRDSIVKKEKKDIGDIVNRVVNDGHAGNDSGYDLNRVETAGDDAFYAVDTTNTDNNNV
eukprot:gene35711-43311_t